MKTALLLVDIQNDFVTGGALGIPGAEAIVPGVNALQQQYDLVLATQDWHPADHGSFAAQHPGHTPGQQITLHGLPQTLWPVHCVQGSAGADFVPGLQMDKVAKVFQKGTDVQVDSYSGFFDNGKVKSTGLWDYLQQQGVQEVHIVGLATDYCVKFTALDAAQLGLRTKVLLPLCRGVELQAGDIDRAVAEMQAAGVEVSE